MAIPQLMIHQRDARIGINRSLARLQVNTRLAKLNIHQQRPTLRIEHAKVEVDIDQSKAWDALARGGTLRWSHFMASQMQGAANQAIGKIAEAGDRMAQITNPRSAIAELARQASRGSPSPLQYVEAPSPDPVKLIPKLTPARIQVGVHPVQYHVQPAELNIQVKPAQAQIYLKQKNSISFSVRQIDTYG